MNDTLSLNSVLQQPRHVLFPPIGQLSSGFGDASWLAAVRASNEHLIPRVVTLGFYLPKQGREIALGGYLQAMLSSLRLHAAELAEDREVVAMVLAKGVAEGLSPSLLAQLLDAVPHCMRTVARPQIEVRLDARSRLSPAVLREVGCTRISVLDHHEGEGPGLLEQAMKAGFSACSYNLNVPLASDVGFARRLHAVLALGPERIVMPAPLEVNEAPSAAHWLQAWKDVSAAGYVAVGGDHYQRAGSRQHSPVGDGLRHCDLAGVPRRDRSDFIGIGLGAFSQIGDVICTHEAVMGRWQMRLSSGRVGVVAGLILSEGERLVDEVVQSLACDHALDTAEFEWRNGASVEDSFPEAILALQPYLERGWLQWEGKVLRLAGVGQLLWRLAAGCFRRQTWPV